LSRKGSLQGNIRLHAGRLAPIKRSTIQEVKFGARKRRVLVFINFKATTVRRTGNI